MPSIRQRGAPPAQPIEDTDAVIPEGVVEDVAGEVVVDPLFAPQGKKAEWGELATAIADIGKVHGHHVLRRASSLARFLHIPTGIFTLDMGLFGGVARSLISMVYGWESSGKSTQAWRLIAQAQRLFPDQDVVLIDAEGTFDPQWARIQGVDVNRLIISQPDNGEQAVDVARTVICAKEVSLVVVDSLAALMPGKEMAKSAEDEVVAMQARLIGRFVRTVSQSLIDERKRNHFPAVLLINQFRNKIQMMGDPRTLPGGNALKFFVSQRWEVKNQEKMGKDARDTEIVELNEHSWVITKNKLGNGMRHGDYTMIRNPDNPYGMGFIDDAKHVMTFARKFGLLTGASSSWYLDGIMDNSNTKMLRLKGLQEVADALYSDLDYYEDLRYRLICMQREANGLQPEGWM